MNRHTVVMEIFSTITSPVFSEFVISIARDEIADLHSDITLFETLRAMNGVRPFILVFLLNLRRSPPEEALQVLMKALESANTEGLLDFLDSPPIIRSVRADTPGRETQHD